MDCRLIGAKPFPVSMPYYCQLDHRNKLQPSRIRSSNSFIHVNAFKILSASMCQGFVTLVPMNTNQPMVHLVMSSTEVFSDEKVRNVRVQTMSIPCLHTFLIFRSSWVYTSCVRSRPLTDASGVVQHNSA